MGPFCSAHQYGYAGSDQAWETQLSLLQLAQQRLKELDLEAAKHREQLEQDAELQAKLFILSIMQPQGDLLPELTFGCHQLSQVPSWTLQVSPFGSSAQVLICWGAHLSDRHV